MVAPPYTPYPFRPCFASTWVGKSQVTISPLCLGKRPQARAVRVSEDADDDIVDEEAYFHM